MTVEKAIDVLDRNYPDKCFGILCDAVDMAIEALEGQKTGNWIVFPVNDMKGRRTGSNRATCDQCGHRRIIHWGDELPKYCESCGSKMEVEHDWGFNQ